MEIKLFSIPVCDTREAEQELNKFLRSKKVLEVIPQFYQNQNGASWHFCVKYVPGELQSTRQAKKKKDYKEILSPEVFEIFSRLRKVRKTISEKENVPAYAVFTDEQMAELAQMKDISKENMKKIHGIGEKTVERFGDLVVGMYKEQL